MATASVQTFAEWFCTQRYLPYRLRKSVIKRICPKILSDHAFEIDFYGLSYRGNTSNGTDFLMYMYGSCETYMLHLMQDIREASGKEEFVFLDVGAHVGNHSLFMSRHATKVYAVEAHPALAASLQEKIDCNSITNTTVFSCGLGNKNETRSFYFADDKNISGSSFCKNHNTSNTHSQDVEIKRGDDLLSTESTGDIDLIKLDIEGYERYALEGLNNTLTRSRPIIIAEISRTSRRFFKDGDDFRDVFPQDYLFFQFSGVHRERSHYRLAAFDYNTHTGHLDVVAIPRENVAWVADKITKTLRKNKCIGGEAT